MVYKAWIQISGRSEMWISDSDLEIQISSRKEAELGFKSVVKNEAELGFKSVVENEAELGFKSVVEVKQNLDSNQWSKSMGISFKSVVEVKQCLVESIIMVATVD